MTGKEQAQINIILENQKRIENSIDKFIDKSSVKLEIIETHLNDLNTNMLLIKQKQDNCPVEKYNTNIEREQGLIWQEIESFHNMKNMFNFVGKNWKTILAIFIILFTTASIKSVIEIFAK